VPATEPLADLARRVLDGAPIDWDSAESSAGHDERPIIRQLRVIEGLAAVHRREPVVTRTRSWTPAVFSNPARAEAPDAWGHLRILERIGRGAFGAVYRAWDSRLDREVALKLLPAPRALDERSSTIIEEGRLLARVRHANVVTIHGAERIGDQIGLWMELVRGQTLEQQLKRGTTFNAADTIAIGIELCGAVAAVHAAGLLHRDIKAHNVTRAEDGRVVLMDFGAGRELDDSSSSDLTGTPLYLAPEVLRGEAATVQSDLYCLGVLLYHLLTGKYPVEGRTIQDVRAAHEQGRRATLKTARPDLPPALVRVIDHAIDPNPRARYQSAAALATELKALTASPWATRLKYIAAAAAVLIVAAAVALGTGGWKPFGPPKGLPRVAVLAFENLGAQPDSDEFALGLSYAIQNNLASVQDISLISFAASSAFPSKGRNLQQIADGLRATYILAGSIFRADGNLRIDVELVQVENGIAIWGESFSRPIADVFAVQDEISKAIVDKLRLNRRWQKTHTTRPDLYDLYLRAQLLEMRRDRESTLGAIELYQQVVAGDREFAPAWAGLANAQANLARHWAQLTAPDRIQAAAQTAIQLDENLAEAQAARANVFVLQRNWPLAEKAFLRAIELKPSATESYLMYVHHLLTPQGRLVDALRVLDRAWSIEPTPYVRRGLEVIQVDSGDYEGAIQSARWIIDRDPTLSFTHSHLARALYLSGHEQEALKVYQNDVDENDWGYRGYLYARLGRRDEAEALAAKNPQAPLRQMAVYAGLGDRERAFQAFAQAVQLNFLRAAAEVRRPEMAIIRHDPRVLKILRGFGLPE
jgi:TolB-like protein